MTMTDFINFLDSNRDLDAPDSRIHEIPDDKSVESAIPNVLWIQKRLTKAFPKALIQVEDTRNDDQHLAVTITAQEFAGQTMIACHKLVYAALEQMRNGRIHAMSLKTIR
jgi:stress-induced morphogen